MPLRYTNRILDHLAREDGRTASIYDLARSFRVSQSDMDVLREAIDALVSDAALVEQGW